MLNIAPNTNTTQLFLTAAVTGASTAGAMYYVFKKQHIKKELLFKKHVERKINEIQRKNNELEKVDKIKTRLISIISHDIVTPLRFMNMVGKKLLVKEQAADDLKEEILNEIVVTAHELEVLTTNVLNWIKYQNENRKPLREDLNLHMLIEQVFFVVGGMAKEKGILLTNDVPDGLTTHQHYEPLRIIIYNLVMNALNFMNEGNITIAAKQINKGLLIIVKDEGFGMTQQQVDNLLSEEVVISSENTMGKKGNGLGFLIIKDLLKFTDGKFTISSVKNKGTRIKLFFPKK